MRMLKHWVAAASRRGSALARWWEDQAWPMRLYSGGGMVMLIIPRMRDCRTDL
mgnify:CR=1 FL=1